MSMSTSLLSASDYGTLASLTGVHAEIIARRLQTRQLNDFKVTEIKELIKGLKTLPGWFHNQPLNQRGSAAHQLGASGKKQQMIDYLKGVLAYQQAYINSGGASGVMDPSALGVGGSASSVGLNPQQLAQAQQAQYRAQQQAAQQAAQRFQANDPYRSYAAPPSSYAAPSPYGSSPYQTNPYQPPRTDYTQYTNRGYPNSSMPSAASNGFQPYGPSSTGYPNGAMSASAAASSSAMSPQAKQAEITRLVSAPAMTADRSPYEANVMTLGRNLLNAYSTTANTGAAGGSYQTTLAFSVAPQYLLKLKKNRSANSTEPLHEVHLRLFASNTMSHTVWDKKFRVLVNSHEITIPEPKKLSKTKKKGLELVRGLDISEWIQTNNTIDVTVFRQSFTVELFQGLVSADLIRIRDTSELMEDMKKKIKEEESRLQAAALERCCIICGSKKDPLRCSRCKNEWYCLAEDHQLLTDQGFRFLHQVQNDWQNIQFATLNASTQQLEYQFARKLIVKPPSAQPMIQLSDDQSTSFTSIYSQHSSRYRGISLFVTEDHDLFVRSQHSSRKHDSGFQKQKAASLLSDDQFQLITHAPRGVAHLDSQSFLFTMDWIVDTDQRMHAFLQLYGFTMAKLSQSQSGRIEWQLDEERVWFQSCLSEITPTAGSDDETCVSEMWVKFFVDSFGCDSLPSWCWQLNQSGARSILSGFNTSSAASSSNSWSITINSIDLRDQLIRLSLHAGFSAEYENHSNSRFIVSIISSRCDSLLTPRISPAVQMQLTPSGSYKGQTWCVNVPNGLLFTRRSRVNEFGQVIESSRTVVVGNCGPEHQRAHWPTHRSKCEAPTPEQDANREREEKKAAQEAMLGKNGRTKLIMPVKVKHEAGAANGDSDVEDGVEEVDALVSLKCPLSLERYEIPARGKNCHHLPCFNLETFLMFSQMSGVWQCKNYAKQFIAGDAVRILRLTNDTDFVWLDCPCSPGPICFKPLPYEELEVNLQMASVLRETDSEISQIRVDPSGEYEPIIVADAANDGSRKRKNPSSSPPPPPPAKIQAVEPERGSDQQPANINGGSEGQTRIVEDWPSAGAPATVNAPVPSGANLPASSPASTSAPPTPFPSTTVSESGPQQAGTADEPIELD